MNFHVGLCNTHDMVTNDGDEITLFVFPEKRIENFDFDYLEGRCRKHIQAYIDVMKDIPHKKRAAARGNRSTFNLYLTGLGRAITSFLKCWVEQQERLEMCYGDLVIHSRNDVTEEYDTQQWAMIT